MKHEGIPLRASHENTSRSFLVYAPKGSIESFGFGDAFASSPLRCLNSAIECGSNSLIVLYFPQRSFCETEELLELCAVLKSGQRTRKITLVALLDSMHAGLIKDLAENGVDHVKMIGELRLTLEAVETLLNDLGPEDAPVDLARAFCPYLHFCRVNESLDMPVCGGYHDILVINDRRLRGLCTEARHGNCKHFRTPRV